MATSIQVTNIPDRIRAQYDRLPQDLDAATMAREVPKQYQRNSEEIQLLKFPSTKNILWDHESTGKPHSLHISCYRKPKLCVPEKVLRFTQRHAESTKQTSCGCVLVGTLLVDDDGEGVVFSVERMDPVGDPNSSTSHAAGDLLIPFTLQNGTKDRSSSIEDYSSALELLKHRCCSKDPVELGNFLLTKGWCSFYSKGDKCVHHLEFDVVTVGTEIKAVPIGPVPIVPTALSKNLSGPMSISHMQGTPKTGYLTMDHTRKLLLVLESDPKVANLPLVGIWVSGVSYAYSPYVWACCLRYLHNSSIQDRVCSPPEPFLLVLYNPTHSRPEFYECSTATGTSKMTFDLFTGYEPVHLNMTGSSSSVNVEVDLNTVDDGPKRDMFDAALQEFSSKLPLDETRRSISPEPTGNDEITPRLMPAPHKSKLPMMQSMVPEVSLFFGDGDSSSYVPTVQHPQNGPTGARHKIPSSIGHGLPAFNSVPPKSVQNSSSQKSVPAYPGHITSMAHSQTVLPSTQAAPMSSAQRTVNQNGFPVSMQSENLRSSQEFPGQPSVRPPAPHPYSSSSMAHPFPASTSATMSYPPHATRAGSEPWSGTHGPRPGFCTCPNCPRPPPQQYHLPSFEPPRGQYHPRPVYNNYGPHPPRLPQPSNPHGMIPNPPHSQQSLPTSTNYSYQQLQSGHPQNYSNMPSIPENITYPYQPGVGNQPLPTSDNMNPPVPRSMTATQGMSNIASNQPLALVTSSQPQFRVAPPPQTSGGIPTQSESYTAAQRTPVQSNEFPQGMAEARRSNQNSDNSGRSSDDSGLSFTPEKHNSPATTSPKATQHQTSPTTEAATNSLSVSAKAMNWENVPPEIYQLLIQQDQQLKQLQAQIEVLTAQQAAQSLNNSAESGLEATNNLTKSPNTQMSTEKCTIATNTSACFPGPKEQVSECIQTSLQKHYAFQQNGDVTQSSSSGSGCETRTPLEIRHRGRLPMNSTQREDVELDISQGELVAIVNNMHDRTIDSVQSDMIVDLPSFQSSPTRERTCWSVYQYMPTQTLCIRPKILKRVNSYELVVQKIVYLAKGRQMLQEYQANRSPRSQESYSDSTAFNTSPRSPISASMCDQNDNQYESEEDEEEEDSGEENQTAPDNPEYYSKLMENIKKLLSQNTTENTTADGYQGDVSSGQSTPMKLANENIRLGEQLQSFLRFDNTPGSPKHTDTTFIPKINYVSMFLDSDTDTSMEINAMAMKYLKDEQLTQLTKLQAKNRLLQGAKSSTKTAMLQKILKAEEDTTPNVTAFGMSPNDLTFATKRYMEKHGLLDGTRSAGGSTQSESTYNESYQLKTNYSTMSSGSEDPVQITHEVVSTPSGRQSLPSNSATPSSGRFTGQFISNGSTPNHDSSHTPYNNSTRSRIPYCDSTPQQDSSQRTHNSSNQRTPFNDSRQSVGFNGTPKPQHIQSRIADHRRFSPNANDTVNTHNASLPKSQSSTPHNASVPFSHNSSVPRRDNINIGAKGRYASPQLTPAPTQARYSPPERDQVENRRYPNENRPVQQEYEDIGRGDNYNQDQGMFLQDRGYDRDKDVPNAYNNKQAFYKRDEVIEDDRVLDITRLKQLPKLL